MLILEIKIAKRLKMRYIFLLAFIIAAAYSAKVKDLASVIGVRENQVIGYGLVVGLSGTGDGSSSKFTIQSIANMLQSVNVKLSPNDIKSKNVAAVMVTGRLPAFARQGDTIDISVSSIGDAKSLMGGTLLLTALKGVDGEIYALGQGALALGGSVGRGGNHPTAATIPSGGIIEREVAYDIATATNASLSLKNSSFDTAKKLQDAINARFRNSALAIDPRTLQVQKPENMSMVEFMAAVLELDVDYSAEQKVVIDERTGTVVSGVGVKVEPTIISHGGITLKIEPNTYAPAGDAPAPNVLDIGDNTSINAGNNTLNVGTDTTVANVARALNKLGASPKDIIAILENLKRAGAIHANLEVI